MNGEYAIGIDLGGTNLRVAAYAGGTEFLEVIHLPTRLREGRERVVRDMCEAVEALMGRGFGRLAGVALGAPGPLELPEGIVRNPPNLPGWDGFALRDAVETALGRPIMVENDANLAALAETKLGAGKVFGQDSLCMLTLGTGVGNGLVLEGKLWHGFSGMAGEAGHTIVYANGGAPCGCGGSGCLEQYASATAVVRMARERMGEAAPPTARGVFLLAMGGDPAAVAVFEAVGYALAMTFTALINTLNMPLYVLGGGVCEAWEMFAPEMFRVLRERSYVYRLTEPDGAHAVTLKHHRTRILRAQLGSAAGLLGACLLPFSVASADLDLEEPTPLAL